jgi:hypothetical protein
MRAAVRASQQQQLWCSSGSSSKSMQAQGGGQWFHTVVTKVASVSALRSCGIWTTAVALTGHSSTSHLQRLAMTLSVGNFNSLAPGHVSADIGMRRGRDSAVGRPFGCWCIRNVTPPACKCFTCCPTHRTCTSCCAACAHTQTQPLALCSHLHMLLFVFLLLQATW